MKTVFVPTRPNDSISRSIIVQFDFDKKEWDSYEPDVHDDIFLDDSGVTDGIQNGVSWKVLSPVPVSGVPSEEKMIERISEIFSDNLDPDSFSRTKRNSSVDIAEYFTSTILPALVALTAENSDLMSKLELSHADADRHFTELLEARQEIEWLRKERKTVFDYDKGLAHENGEMKFRIQELESEIDKLKNPF
jgi:hypothetical protein